MVEIQYEYAVDQEGDLIHIRDITPEIRKEKAFNCPECNLKMIARLGHQRGHHFSHDGQACGIESYTHKIGKLIFHQRYCDALKNAIPVNIYADVPVKCDHCCLGPCPIGHNFIKMDLIERFKKIDLEKYIPDGLIPDLLLTGEDGKQIFVEIHVTSPCSQDKLDSGKAIIEFHISGPEAFSLLLADPIIEGEKISFHNFPWTRRKALNNECGKELHDVFLIFPSKKCFLPQRDKAVSPLKYPIGTYFQSVQYVDLLSHSELIVRESERAYNNGVPIANCFLCRHHITGQMFNHVHCKKEACAKIKNSDAAGCNSYLPDPKVFHFRNISDQDIIEHQGKMDALYKSGKMPSLMIFFYKKDILTIMTQKYILRLIESINISIK